MPPISIDIHALPQYQNAAIDDLAGSERSRSQHGGRQGKRSLDNSVRGRWRTATLAGLIVTAVFVACASVAGAAPALAPSGLSGAGTLAPAAVRSANAPAPLDPPTWSDEFDGTSLNLTRWGHRAEGPRHDGILTRDAVSVGGGALTIKTYTEAGKHYSGMISTQKAGSAGFEQTYGYFEARVKFNSTPGQWSAFWLQSPTIGSPLGDPTTAGVEMDIAEHRARCNTTATAPCSAAGDISNRIQQALIWDGYGQASKATVKLSDPPAGLGNDSWHRWGLRWTPSDVTFYYDDVALWSMTGPISRRSQYMILSSEVGQFFAGAIPPGGYGSRETSTTNMQVDYVRVWASPDRNALRAGTPRSRPAATIGSSRCDRMRLLGVTRYGPAFRVRIRTHCSGNLSVKGTASVLIRRRLVPVVVRARRRSVVAGMRTVNLSFARSPSVGQARRNRRRLPVALVTTFVPKGGEPRQTVRRQLLLVPPMRSGTRR
jgi:beta-glucanase (GH16 family)